jgi:hypothetical protein
MEKILFINEVTDYHLFMNKFVVIFFMINLSEQLLLMNMMDDYGLSMPEEINQGTIPRFEAFTGVTF